MADATEAETPQLKKDVVPSQYRDKYKETGGTCGDFIAEGLSKVAKDGVEALATVKAENGIPAAKWKDMNPGMQRMNLANTLRATYLRGDTIKILGREYNLRHQSEDFNGEVTNDRGVLTKLAEFVGLQQTDRTVDALQRTFFPPEKKSVIAKAQREEAKAKRDGEKAEAKAKREAEKAEAATKRDGEKRDAAIAKAKEALGKAETAQTAAKADSDAADKALADNTDDAAKGKLEKAAKTAKGKLDKADTKVSEAKAKLDAAEKPAA